MTKLEAFLVDGVLTIRAPASIVEEDNSDKTTVVVVDGNAAGEYDEEAFSSDVKDSSVVGEMELGEETRTTGENINANENGRLMDTKVVVEDVDPLEEYQVVEQDTEESKKKHS